MKLEKDKKWGFYICPECGLPLRFNRDPARFQCDTIWVGGLLEGCGFTISRFNVDKEWDKQKWFCSLIGKVPGCCPARSMFESQRNRQKMEEKCEECGKSLEGEIKFILRGRLLCYICWYRVSPYE